MVSNKALLNGFVLASTLVATSAALAEVNAHTDQAVSSASAAVQTEVTREQEMRHLFPIAMTALVSAIAVVGGVGVWYTRKHPLPPAPYY